MESFSTQRPTFDTQNDPSQCLGERFAGEGFHHKRVRLLIIQGHESIHTGVLT